MRELANVLKRAAVFCSGDRLDVDTIRDAIGTSISGHPEARAAKGSAPSPPSGGAPRPGAGEELSTDPSNITLAEVERRHILSTFERLGGNVTKTASALGVDRRTLQRRLRSLGRDVGDD